MESPLEKRRTFVSVAMAQMPVRWSRPEDNVRTACDAVGAAHRAGADIVVLPECSDIGWLNPDARALAQPIPGAYVGALQAAARQYEMYVVAGVTERCGDTLYNSAVLIDNRGDLQLHHRKINELVEGRCLYGTGTRLSVIHTPLGILGLLICADNFMDSLELGAALGRMGVDLLLSPCAWAVPPESRETQAEYLSFWLEPYQKLARQYQMGIVGVSGVGRMEGGEWAGYSCIGSSVAVGPGGAVLATAPYGESASALVMARMQSWGAGEGSD